MLPPLFLLTHAVGVGGLRAPVILIVRQHKFGAQLHANVSISLDKSMEKNIQNEELGLFRNKRLAFNDYELLRKFLK